MRRIIFAAALLAGCQTTPAVVEPTPENVAAMFERAVFSEEVEGREILLRKWTSPPVVITRFDDERLVLRDAEDIGRHGEAIEAMTGLRMEFTADNGAATLNLIWTQQRHFQALADQAFAGRKDAAAYFGQRALCFAVTATEPDEPGVIVAGAAIFGTDISERDRRDCLVEEFVQVFGLMNDGCAYRPSLFCPDDRVFEMTPADRVMLRTLYDPRLKPGMTKAEAMPIARQIIAEQMR